MQHLFQSVFLQALGYAIANSLWQTALIWLAFLLINVVGKLTASRKYRVAVAAQGISFIWFVVTLQFYYTEYNRISHLSVNAAHLPSMSTFVTAGTGFRAQMTYWLLRAETVLPYLSAAYLALMLLLCIRWILGYRRTQQIRMDGLMKIPVQWRLFVRNIAAQLNIIKEIRIYLSDKIHTPLTIGFLKPIILVPVASINHLTTDQLEAVILHELAHIKRHDYLVNIILSVVELTLFFNPFTQLLSKNIRKERENSCDDWVLQFQYSASVYAEALLQLAYLQSIPSFAMTAAHDKHDLLGRVKRMIGQKENQFNYRRQLLALFLVTAILSSVAWLNPAAYPATKPVIAVNTPTRTQIKLTVTAEPLLLKVDNPLFSPAYFLRRASKKEIKETELVPVSKQKDIPEVPEKSIASPAAEAIQNALTTFAGVQAPNVNMANADVIKTNFDKFSHFFDTASFSKFDISSEQAWEKFFSLKTKRSQTDTRNTDTDVKAANIPRFVYMNAETQIKMHLAKAMREISVIKLDKMLNDVASSLQKYEHARMNMKIPSLPSMPGRRKIPEQKTKIKEREQTNTQDPDGIKAYRVDDMAERPEAPRVTFNQLVKLAHDQGIDLVALHFLAKYIVDGKGEQNVARKVKAVLSIDAEHESAKDSSVNFKQEIR